MRKERRSSGLARHEAGHAVVALVLGFRVRRVFLGPRGAGGCWFVGRGGVRLRLAEAVVLLAGPMAELRASGPAFRRTSRRASPGSDLWRLGRLGLRRVPRYLAEVWEWREVQAVALRVLRENWACVLRVAAALEVRDLGGDEVRAMARRSSPSRRT